MQLVSALYVCRSLYCALFNFSCVTIGHMSWMSCWHVYWEAFINSDSTHPVKQASYIRLMLNESFHQSSLGNLRYCYRWNGCNRHLSSRCHAGYDLHGSRHGNYFNQRMIFETNSTNKLNYKLWPTLLLSRSLSGNKLHMLSKSESDFVLLQSLYK